MPSSWPEPGFTVLTFDNRNFGASEGSRPQHLNTSEQVEDLKNAISYLAARRDVDAERIGLACVCLGAGYGLEVASMDRRVKAVALVGGGYNITDTYLGFLGADGFAGYMDMLNASRQSGYESAEEQFMRAVAGPPDYAPSAMPVREAFEYYSRAHDRGGACLAGPSHGGLDGANHRLERYRSRPPGDPTPDRRARDH